MPHQKPAFSQKLYVCSDATYSHWLIVVDTCKHLTKITGVVIFPLAEASPAKPETAAWLVIVVHFIVARDTLVIGQITADSAIGEPIADPVVENGVESFRLLLFCVVPIANKRHAMSGTNNDRNSLQGTCQADVCAMAIVMHPADFSVWAVVASVVHRQLARLRSRT
jgi:hypothetical protein